MNVPPNGRAEFVIRVIRDLGFPVIVALYLLLQVTPALDKMSTALVQLVAEQRLTRETLQHIEERQRRAP